MNRFSHTAQINNQYGYDYGIGYDDDSQSQEESDSYGMEQGGYPYSYGMSKTAYGKSNPLSNLGSLSSYGQYNKSKINSTGGKKDPYASIGLGNLETKKDPYSSINIGGIDKKDPYASISLGGEKKDPFDIDIDTGTLEKKEEEKPSKTKKKKKGGGGVLDFLEDKFEKEEEEEKKREEEEKKRMEEMERRIKEREKEENEPNDESHNDNDSNDNELENNISEKKLNKSKEKSVHEDEQKHEDIQESIKENEPSDVKDSVLSDSNKPQEPVEQEPFSANEMEEYLKKKKKIDFSLAKPVDVDNNEVINERSKEESERESSKKDSMIKEEKSEKDKSVEISHKEEKSVHEEKPKEVVKQEESIEEDYQDFDDNVESLNQSSNLSQMNLRSDEKRKSSLKPRKSSVDKEHTIMTESNISDRINKVLSNNDSNILSSSENKYDFKEADLKYEEHSEIKEESHNSKEASVISQKKPPSIPPSKKEEISQIVTETIKPILDVNLIQNLISQEVQKQLSSTLSSFQNTNMYNTLPGYKPSIVPEVKKDYEINTLQYNVLNTHKSYDVNNLSISKAGDFSVQRFPELKGRNLLITLKLEAALTEEQKRRSMLEYEIQKMKEINSDLQTQVRTLKGFRYTNTN